MIQQMAKKRPQDIGNARILAKELVRAKKQRQRMHQSKATLNSIQMQLQEQIGTPQSSDVCVDHSYVQDQRDLETEYRCYEGCQSACEDSGTQSGYETIFDGVDQGIPTTLRAREAEYRRE